jgi:hypothetical protein
MKYDWYDCPVPSLALARRRLRERRAEVPDPFQVVVANMCAGADQPPLHHQPESATAPAGASRATA